MQGAQTFGMVGHSMSIPAQEKTAEIAKSAE